ncbi:MAG TPA: cysteine-rich CWC family protein [Acidovorax sp.]|nr:cysteine-rich CWC family protein [Acidovorax sp.]
MCPSTQPTAAVCPLCGQPNQCAVAAGRPAHSCWCMTAAISPEVLAAIPEAERGKTCICPACGKVAPSAPQPL